MIANEMKKSLERASYIRKMFEEGDRLKKERGAENVFDFTLGNPFGEPPVEFRQALKNLAENPIPGMHRYMSNSGYSETRAAVALSISANTGLELTERNIIMTCGAAGGMNVALKALLNPGDEVIVPAPYFVEYGFYAANAGGRIVTAKTRPDFQIDAQEIEKVINERTRAIIINSPNNPTGAVYSEDSLGPLAAVLEEHAAGKKSRPITILSDEPYKKIVYDGVKVPELFNIFDDVLIIYSHSKDLNLPGERIGYIAASPKIPYLTELMDALNFCNRTLGFVNAPALMQRLVTGLQDIKVDVSDYQNKRDILSDHLTELGFELVKPQGAFYLFPKSPWEDDAAFVKKAAQMGILMVPGSGFAGPGYFRMAYCVDMDTIERSLPVFEELARAVGLKAG